MTVYMLVKTGIYISSIWGVFENFSAARECFDNRYNEETKKKERRYHNDFDGYHKYFIVRVEVGKFVDFNTDLVEKSPYIIKYEPLSGRTI